MSLDHMQSLPAPAPSHQDSESELDHHHLKEDLCRHCGVTNELQILPQDASRERRKFSHTSKIQREKLIDMITTQNYSIKKASVITKIPYSTAKKIFIRFRTKFRRNFSNNITASKQAGYLTLENEQKSNVQIFCTIGGGKQAEGEVRQWRNTI